MKFIKTIIFGWILSAAFFSCRKDNTLKDLGDVPGLGGDTWTQTSIDKWIYDSLVVPHNIDVKYKWDQFAVNHVDKNMVPVYEDKVIPVMSAVKRVWIQPYISEAGLAFFNKYSPKFFVLAGSGAVNPDGTVVLGTAEGGKQIQLFQLNEYRNKSMKNYIPSDSNINLQIFHTIHHEFAHIFDQTIKRPSEFDNVTQGGYSSSWYTQSDDEARSKGFITAYASSEAGEDFAEMVALMLLFGKSQWNLVIANIGDLFTDPNTGQPFFVPNNTAQKAIHQKEDIIVGYFKTFWKIDFYSLQAKVRKAVANEIY